VMGFPETGIGIYPGLGGTQRTSRRLGKELAKYLIFTARLIPAEAALSIGLVDHIFLPEEMDQKIRDLVAQGKGAPGKGMSNEDLPPKYRQIKTLFSDENIEGWLTGKYLQSNDPLTAEIAKTIAKKARVALRFANQIVDEGYKLPLSEGLKQELAHLNEVFSTADALVGLMSVGKRTPPEFQGK
jgi:enoyl-CoA hydratase/carnithine racemase